MRTTLTLLLVLTACRPPVVESTDPWTHGGDGGGDGDGSDGDGDGGDDDGDVSDVSVHVHDDVATILVVDWDQARPGQTWLEFRTPDTDWTSSRPHDREAGAASDVVLGVPADTDVELRIAGDGWQSGIREATTGSLPFGLPEPTVEEWNPDLASPEDYVLISIDAGVSGWYDGPYYTIIMNRDGRILWYRETPHDLVTMYPRVAKEGTYLMYEESSTYSYGNHDPKFHRVTLDLSTDIEEDFTGFRYGWDELDDGTIIRDSYHTGSYTLVEQNADGDLDIIWRCADWSGGSGGSGCYTNTVSWNRDRDSITWSLVSYNTVLEIDRERGEVVNQWGEYHGSANVLPAEAMFNFNHFPNFTPDGTLIVSNHHDDGPVDEQRAREYELMDDGTLREIWEYGEDVDEYAYYSGEAYRIDNGNTLINYGTGGAAREVTHDKEVAWDIDFGGRYLTGHMSLVGDLYDLNQGPAAR